MDRSNICRTCKILAKLYNLCKIDQLVYSYSRQLIKSLDTRLPNSKLTWDKQVNVQRPGNLKQF